MPSRIFFQEVKRFFKENIKIYSIFFFIGLISFVLLFLFQNINNKNQIVPTIDENARMSTFIFYVENSQQGVYTNSNLLDTIFLDKEYVKEAEKFTGVEISKRIDEQLESDFVPTLLDRGFIGVGRDVHDETMLFQANLGDEQENLAVANYYYELLTSNEIPFFNNKTVYVVREPYFVEIEDEELNVSSTKSLKQTAPVTILKGAIFSIVGLLVGIVFAFIYHILTNKINYSFSYEVETDDLFFIERNSSEQLISTIINPNFGDKIILSQNNLPGELKKNIEKNVKKNYVYSNQLMQENPNINYEEIVFIIVENETDKKWYYQQRESLKTFKNNIKIIQVPANLIESL